MLRVALFTIGIELHDLLLIVVIKEGTCGRNSVKSI